MIKEQITKKRVAIFMVALSALFYLYEFFIRVSTSVLIEPLMTHFSVHATAFGAMSACFFWGYMPMQIPAGFLGDRWGPKRVLVMAVLLCAVATIAFAHTHSIAWAGIMRFVIGITASFAYIGPLMIASRWLKPQSFAMASGFIQLLGCSGAILGGTPIALMAKHIGWQSTYHYVGIFGLALALLLLCFLKENPPKVKAKKTNTPPANLKQYIDLLKNRQTCYIAFIGFALWAPISVFAELWGIPFLMQAKGLNNLQAAQCLIWVWIGIAAGGPFMGWLSDHLKSRKKPMLLAFVIALISDAVLIYLPSHATIHFYYLALVFFGLSAASQCVTFGLVRDVQPLSRVGTGIGFNNMAVILGGTLLQPLSGWILETNWHGQWGHGIHIYSLHNYQLAFLVLPILSTAGLMCTLWLLHETHCQPRGKQHGKTSTL